MSAGSTPDPAALPAAHGVKYRPEVDGLRAIAVGSVILYHADVPPFSGGYAGVDIFFVISGYLISSIIMGDLAAQRFSFVNFYERRIRRIFPALFMVLAVSTVAAWLLFTPRELRDFGQSLVATVGFLSNYYFRAKTGYFAPDVENAALIHMWSLSVEEQFYVAFPILLIVIARLSKTSRVGILAAAGILSLGWCLYREQTDAVFNFFSTPSRAWELIAGALVALVIGKGVTPQGRVASGLSLIGFAAMVAPLFLATKLTPWPGMATIPVVFGTALVLAFTSAASPVGRLLALRPMVAIGLVSYSAYLWHQPLFAFARTMHVGGLPPIWIALLIVATFVLAWISWRFVEIPFRDKKRIGRGAIYALFFIGSALLAGTGLALHFKQGFPSRYPETTRAILATAQPSPFRNTCHTDGLNYRHPEKACRYFGGITDWAVLGDSHAIEPGYALAERLRTSDHGLVHLSFSGCQAALTFDSNNPGCSAWTRETVAWLEHQPGIKNVLMAYRPGFYLYGDQLQSYPRVPDGHPNFLRGLGAEDARAQYWQSFDTIVSRLTAAGKHVVIMRPLPDLPAHVERFIYRPATGNGVARAWFEQRNAAIEAHLSELAKLPNVTVFDPADALCDATQCRAIDGGTALYFDDNHLSIAGARRVIAKAHDQGVLP